MQDNEKIQKSEEKWENELTEEEYNIICKKGTEFPFSGEFVNTDEKGMYHCRACGQELFLSSTKFHSDSG